MVDGEESGAGLTEGGGSGGGRMTKGGRLIPVTAQLLKMNE